MEKRARAVFDISFDPFSLEDDDRLSGLGVTMCGDDSAGGELAEEESSTVGGVIRKVGKFDSRVGAGLPHGGIGKANRWKHLESMKERIRSDNPWG
jgi:hypothetical protein